jgi:hypothetical protein
LAGAAGKLSASETHDRFLLASYDLGIARTGIIDPKVINMFNRSFIRRREETFAPEVQCKASSSRQPSPVTFIRLVAQGRTCLKISGCNENFIFSATAVLVWIFRVRSDTAWVAQPPPGAWHDSVDLELARSTV